MLRPDTSNWQNYDLRLAACIDSARDYLDKTRWYQDIVHGGRPACVAGPCRAADTTHYDDLLH